MGERRSGSCPGLDHPQPSWIQRRIGDYRRPELLSSLSKIFRLMIQIVQNILKNILPSVKLNSQTKTRRYDSMSTSSPLWVDDTERMFFFLPENLFKYEFRTNEKPTGFFFLHFSKAQTLVIVSVLLPPWSSLTILEKRKRGNWSTLFSSCWCLCGPTSPQCRDTITGGGGPGWVRGGGVNKPRSGDAWTVVTVYCLKSTGT